MSDIFFLVLRRLRTPLILLIVVYAIATFGMTLIPGLDPDGQPWKMSFFHAFYFVSFMGTTIGFGEIPYPFTDAQRVWVLICIYTSVIAWLYAIGNMLRLLQDETFQNALARGSFERSIRRIDQTFYIICGYGETGLLINRGLSELGLQTVVIDYNAESTLSIELQDLATVPIVLNADATEPQSLIAAGINNSHCGGVIAVTAHDHVNLEVAVASKLLEPQTPVICRSEIEDEAENMASFGTNKTINPYLIFAQRLNLLAHKPSLHRVQNWFINQHNAKHINEEIAQQGLPKGRWVLCGYGRLGKAIQASFDSDEGELIIVDANYQDQETDASTNLIQGRGTEADTLNQAGIKDASVIIAATNDDANNLSILITARQLNSKLVTIGRVCKPGDHSLFIKAGCDYIIRSSQIVANEVLTYISRPLVTNFLRYSNTLSQLETEDLIHRISKVTGDKPPVTWRLILNKKNAPALARYIESGGSLSIDNITHNEQLPKADCIPLLLLRNNLSQLLPDKETPLQLDDELLVCGKRYNINLIQLMSHNEELIDSLINQNTHQIPLVRWLSRRQKN